MLARRMGRLIAALKIACVMAVVTVFVLAPVVAVSAEQGAISLTDLQCDVTLDSKIKDNVVVVLDLRSLDPMRVLAQATIHVDFWDSEHKKLSSQTFLFIGKQEQALQAGKKYVRRFQYQRNGAAKDPVKVTVSSADALVKNDPQGFGR